ncbi:MAG TPA: hypothetical protein VEI94_05050 [Candidatus Bathyarchaeia archaeon]|nr:hypothetical protein [Candidatus Bathyarchaeia archaeon]
MARALELSRPGAPVERRAWDAQRLGAVAVLVVAAPLLAALYRENPSLGAVPETLSATLTAHALIRTGEPRLNEYFPKAVPGRLRSYALRFHGDAIYGIEPLASSLTFAPFLLGYRDVRPAVLDRRGANNGTAARVTALSVVLLGIWLLDLAPIGRALAVTAIIALGTCYRTVVGVALWQHTSATPWLLLGLMLWSRARQTNVLFPFAGACLAVATACRPILVPPALLVVVDAWSSTGLRRMATWATGAIVAAIGLLALIGNWCLHGSLLGGRADLVSTIATTHAVPSYFHFSIFNMLGLLFAPSRGLFPYSPVLLFAAPGLLLCLGSGASAATVPAPTLRGIGISGILIFLLYGFIATWWGGWVFGPRYMADVMPFLALWLALTPLPGHKRPLLAMLFAASIVWSIAVQEIGVRTYPCGWNDSPGNIDLTPERLWSLRDTEISRCLARLTAPSGRATHG